MCVFREGRACRGRFGEVTLLPEPNFSIGKHSYDVHELIFGLAALQHEFEASFAPRARCHSESRVGKAAQVWYTIDP